MSEDRGLPSGEEVARTIINYSGPLGAHYADVANRCAEEVLALFKAAVPRIKADAWSEGFRKGQDSELIDPASFTSSTFANPYRIEAQS